VRSKGRVTLIDDRAVIHPGARLGEGVSVGPFSVIGDKVSLGDETWVGPHVVINGPTEIGRRNKIFQFSSLGELPQDKKYRGEETRLVIGDDNVIREYCTFNRGTVQDRGETRIGNKNWIMAYVHIAHDCVIGDSTIFANNASLAGHVTIEDFAILGGFTLVHQFCVVGSYSFTAMNSVVAKDIPPFLMIAGHPAQPRGLNLEGLRRHHFDSDAVRALKNAYKVLYRSGYTINEAIDHLAASAEENAVVQRLIDFIRRSRRGIVR